jgi:hypothetical protein
LSLKKQKTYWENLNVIRTRRRFGYSVLSVVPVEGHGIIAQFEYENKAQPYGAVHIPVDGSNATLFPQETSGYSGFAASARGRLLLWFPDGTVLISDLHGAPVGPICGPGQKVLGATVLNDGRFAFSHQTGSIVFVVENESIVCECACENATIQSLVAFGTGGFVSLTTRGAFAFDSEGLLIDSVPRVDSVLLSLSNEALLVRKAAATCVWFPHSGEVIPIPCGSSRVMAVRDPFGSFLTWAPDGALRLWASDGNPLSPEMRHGGSCVGAFVRRDGAVVSWGSDQTIRIWSREGEQRYSRSVIPDTIIGLTENRSGELLGWGDVQDRQESCGLFLWAPEEHRVRHLQGMIGAVPHATVMNDGAIIASNGREVGGWSENGIPLSVPAIQFERSEGMGPPVPLSGTTAFVRVVSRGREELHFLSTRANHGPVFQSAQSWIDSLRFAFSLSLVQEGAAITYGFSPESAIVWKRDDSSEEIRHNKPSAVAEKVARKADRIVRTHGENGSFVVLTIRTLWAVDVLKHLSNSISGYVQAIELTNWSVVAHAMSALASFRLKRLHITSATTSDTIDSLNDSKTYLETQPQNAWAAEDSTKSYRES